MDEILASLIILQHQVRMAHWEIHGPNFHSLHLLFGIQYDEISKFVDRVAEFNRIRGKHTLTLNQALQQSHVKDLALDGRTWEAIVAMIGNGFTILARVVQDSEHESRAWNNIADDLHEYLTKQAWLLRSHIQ